MNEEKKQEWNLSNPQYKLGYVSGVKSAIELCKELGYEEVAYDLTGLL